MPTKSAVYSSKRGTIGYAINQLANGLRLRWTAKPNISSPRLTTSQSMGMAGMVRIAEVSENYSEKGQP